MSILIFVDLFRSVIGVSSLLSLLISGGDQWLSKVLGVPVSEVLVLQGILYFTILCGAIIGLAGLNTSRASLVSVYAVSILMRIVITVSLCIVTLLHFRDIVEQMVDKIVNQMIDDAHRRGLPDPKIDRDALAKPIEYYLGFMTIAQELISDILAIYFAYVTKSLAVWMQRGEIDPRERLMYSFAIPPVSPAAPLLHRQSLE